jgi:hypothetical protein
MADAMSYIVKWSAKEHTVLVDKDGTVLCLKKAIEVQTGVKVERQKLLNLKFKGVLNNNFFYNDCFT